MRAISKTGHRFCARSRAIASGAWSCRRTGTHFAGSCPASGRKL